MGSRPSPWPPETATPSAPRAHQPGQENVTRLLHKATRKQKCSRLSSLDFMITGGRKWVAAGELGGGSRRGETAPLLPARLSVRRPSWVMGRASRWVPPGRVSGWVLLGRGGPGFAFESQDSFHVIPHRFGDYSRIDETHDCRRETQGLSDTRPCMGRKGGVILQLSNNLSSRTPVRDAGCWGPLFPL